MRLGWIQYLNILPLTLAWKHQGSPLFQEFEGQGGELLWGVPSQQNKRLLRGELDLVSCSSILLAGHTGNTQRFRVGSFDIEKQKVPIRRALPSYGLSCEGPVQSVRLFSKYPLKDLAGRKVGVSSESLTSFQLTRVLLQDSHVFSFQKEFSFQTLDAFVGIGDRCLRGEFQAPYEYDLGELWSERTGLPFVYMLYACQEALGSEQEKRLEGWIEKALAWSQNHLSLLESYCERYQPLSFQAITTYLKRFRYRLTSQDEQGLRLFYKKIDELETRQSNHIQRSQLC